jgi:hypothetical protein
MPTLFRWLRNLAFLAVGGYIAMFALANLGQPQQREIVETIPIHPIQSSPGGVARPGVRLVARTGTVGVGARGVGVRPGTPTNRGGPVNRAGRR